MQTAITFFVIYHDKIQAVQLERFYRYSGVYLL